MSRVFVSDGTGTVIYVFADDHCPAHVYARHRGAYWIARAGFSFIADEVELIGIAPLKSIPLQRVVNRLLGDVRAQLALRRQSWWIARRMMSLANQWIVVSAGGKIEHCRRRTPMAKQIAHAVYIPSLERLQIAFRDGTTAEESIKP
jgi:hypothetical protein